LLLVFFAQQFGSLGQSVTTAIAVISSANSTNPNLSGWVQFNQISTSAITVSVYVTNIVTNPNSLHGIHIHAYGDLRGLLQGYGPMTTNATGPESVGSHFDPFNTNNHSCPVNGVSPDNHAGDLGNWEAVNGVINQTQTFYSFAIVNTITSVVGRAIVIHANTDNCHVTSSSSSRLGVGVIGIAYSDVTNNAVAYTGGNTQAVCVLQGTNYCTGSSCSLGAAGFVLFEQSGNGYITVSAQVAGVNADHGFHIHTFGDISNSNGTNAGGHFNPDNHTHNLPPNIRHLGDLGSINTFVGIYGLYQNKLYYTPVTSFTIDNIIGHSVIIHQNVDHGPDPTCAEGTTSGQAGNRIFQCVIGIVNMGAGIILPTPNTTSVLFDNTWTTSPCTTAPTASSSSSSVSHLFGISVLLWFVLCRLVKS